ncbi:uncharacterized protein LOC128882721 [Hylaeus volcanicus]|uniref:uncharacterized protein LOC128882721 n=1 Tax=Hylaeus volcanicus TaxID=313075 RepID=UPI0023B80FD8|nr:uncharacterized protein LOC128882721 [Hylaeus volcanicus]
MGPLPPERITPQRAFLSTGVDYAGPMKLRTTPGRGHRTYKGYIALSRTSIASSFYKDAAASLAADGTDWSFIPPHAPHFGGLLKAGVKTVKHHLRRVIQNATLTFEEITTLLCQVEACVTSRPLQPLPDDATDLTALTPWLHKWRQQRENLEVGTLVLLRDELHPPAKWPLGRVETIHPGTDGQTRVATVRMISGSVTRPIVKLCPLPVPTADVTCSAKT